jgi:hypothetical protein
MKKGADALVGQVPYARPAYINSIYKYQCRKFLNRAAEGHTHEVKIELY